MLNLAKGIESAKEVYVEEEEKTGMNYFLILNNQRR